MNGSRDVAIPAGLVEEMARLYGAPGHAWLDRLPDLVGRALERWSLEPDGPPRHGAHGLVLPVRRDDTPLTLKIAYPDAVTAQEVTGLRAWDGHGTVRLVDSNPAEGVLLMERLDAGRDLTSLPIDAAVEAAGALTRRLAIAPCIDAPFVTSTTRALDIATGSPAAWERTGRPFPASRLQRAIDLARSLTRTGATTLATWDLHSENVLWGERAGWTM
ncbi:MAG: aminoglycoside phosphotransferase family protein, partial [Thermomicrobiales bacterium]